MKVLVTGSSGFIGSHLTAELLRLGHEVLAIERYVTGRYGKLSREILTEFADLVDFEAVSQIVRRTKPEVVINLASISPVNYSYDHWQEVFETNTLASISLAESCRKSDPNLVRFIQAGTTEEYGTTPERPAKETSPCLPNSPYSASKLAVTTYLTFMMNAYSFPASICRATNTYGRENDTNFFIERAIVQMLGNEPVVYLGDPEATREFMYVEDHVSAYLALLRKDIDGIFNFSTEKPLKLPEVAEVMRGLCGFRGEIRWNSIPRRPLDISNHTIDSSKARSSLGWEPRWSLEDGLAATVHKWKAVAR